MFESVFGPNFYVYVVGGNKHSKIDHQTKSQTMKKGMSFDTITMPRVIDDMRSNNAAGNVVVSNFMKQVKERLNPISKLF